MEKSSKIKLAVSLYLNSLKIVDIITKDEVIFPKEVAQKDYKELVCYAHSLFMAYNETHGKQLDDSIFYDSIADFCKSHFSEIIMLKKLIFPRELQNPKFS